MSRLIQMYILYIMIYLGTILKLKIDYGPIMQTFKLLLKLCKVFYKYKYIKSTVHKFLNITVKYIFLFI